MSVAKKRTTNIDIMEDNKSPCPLNEEELQKVTGGVTEEQCKEMCEAQGMEPSMFHGHCTCMHSLEEKTVN